MEKRILVIFFLFCSKTLFAQQRPQYSQYMLNNYLLNPAVAGTTEHYDLRSGYRLQWLGFEDAPRTFYASAHGQIGAYHGPNKGRHRNDSRRHHGIGAMVVNDVTGPTSRTSAYLSYAYNMRLFGGFRGSFGAFAGAQQFRIDSEKFKVNKEGDLSKIDPNSPLLTSDLSKIVPDASFGFWLYDKNFYAGASIHQIFQNKLFFNDYLAGMNKLNNHYFVTAGYKFMVNKEIAIIPSTLIKFVSPAPVSFDINTKVRYKDLAFAGLSYRSDNSFVVLAGVVISQMIEVGYSFDYATSTIGKFDSGSHEIMVGFKLKQRGNVYSPSDFW